MAFSFSKDKIPPHDAEAESATLGAILLDPDAIDAVIQHLRPDSFYSVQNRKIFSAILSLYAEGKNIDLITLTEKLRLSGELESVGGPGYLATLTDKVPTSANVEFYAKIVLDRSVRRKLLNISAKISADSRSETEESRAILEEAQKQLFELTDASQSATIDSPKELVPEAISAIERLFKNRDSYSGIPSGFPDLDAMTSGFQNSELIIIGARPSVGKTALALTMASNIAIKKKIAAGFFSLEMSGLQLMLRILSMESHISTHSIRTGFLKLSDLETIQDAAGRIYEAPLYFVDMPNMRLLDLRAVARRLRTQYDVQIIFIDYLTLITSENTLLPRHEQIAEISRSLKALARELDIPIVALSQVRRDAEGKTPTLADLRESGSIEQDADVVMFLHRERGAAEEAIETKLIVAKQRNGPVGDIDILFRPKYTEFVSKERE